MKDKVNRWYICLSCKDQSALSSCLTHPVINHCHFCYNSADADVLLVFSKLKLSPKRSLLTGLTVLPAFPRALEMKDDVKLNDWWSLFWFLLALMRSSDEKYWKSGKSLI